MEQDNTCISWKNLPWVLFKRKIFHLQCKIYKAKKDNNFRLVRRLQKLLIQSRSSHFIATRFLTNSCSEYNLSENERYGLASSIKDSLKDHSFLRELRFCGHKGSLEFGRVIVIQYILRLALEPIYYEKSNWIVWKREQNLSIRVFKRMESYLKKMSRFGWKKVLRFDLSPSSININYSSIKKKLYLPAVYKLFISKGLTENYFDTYKVKDGIADILRQFLLCTKSNFDKFYKDFALWQKDLSLNKFLNTVFYFFKDGDNFYKFIDRLKHFLKDEGLILNFSSVFMSNLDLGFDFFGWFFHRVHNKKISISLSHNNWILHKKLLKSILNKNYSTESKLKKFYSLHLKWMEVCQFILRSKRRSKFYVIKKLLLNYSKSLKSLEKRFLFESFKYNSISGL